MENFSIESVLTQDRDTFTSENQISTKRYTTQKASVTFEDVIYGNNQTPDFNPTDNNSENMSYMFKLVLNVDFNRIEQTGIMGYKITVPKTHASTSTDAPPEYFEASTYFLEDFVGRISEGEKDLESLRKRVLEVRTAVVSELDINDRDGVVDVQELRMANSNKFRVSGKTLVADYLEDATAKGMIPVPIDNLIEAVGGPRYPIDLKKNTGETPGVGGFSNKITLSDGRVKQGTSLTAMRFKPGEEDVSLVDCNANAIFFSLEEDSGPEVSEHFGKVVKYISNSFLSERYIEISSKHLDSRKPVLFSITPILPDEIMEEYVANGLYEPETDRLDLSLAFADDFASKLSDVNDPSVRCISATPGELILEIDKNDIIVNNIQVETKTLNQVTGETVGVQTENVSFGNTEYIKTYMLEDVLNTYPFYNEIRCHSLIGGVARGSSRTLAVPGLFVDRSSAGQLTEQPDYGYFILKNKLSGIEVNFRDWPSNCIRVDVYRRVTDTRESTLVGTFNTAGLDELNFIDTNVPTGRFVDYYCVFTIQVAPSPESCLQDGYNFVSSGKNMLSSASQIVYEKVSNAYSTIKRSIIRPGGYSLGIDKNPRVITDRANNRYLGFEASLSSVGNVENYEKILQSLEINPNAKFSDADSNLKERTIPVFKVTRTNLISQDTKVLGYSVGGDKRYIIDGDVLKKVSLSKNFKEQKFLYTFDLYLPTLFSLKKFAISEDSKQTSGTILESISVRKFGKQDETLGIPSLDFLKDSYNLAEVIERHKTGVTENILYDPYVLDNSELNLGISIDGKDTSFGTEISWFINGNLKGVTSFLLYCKYSNTKKLVGIVPASNDILSYAYVDGKNNKAVARKYSISILNEQGEIKDLKAEFNVRAVHSGFTNIGNLTERSSASNSDARNPSLTPLGQRKKNDRNPKSKAKEKAEKSKGNRKTGLSLL